MKRWLVAVTVLVLAALGAALAYAPYLPQLAVEGFPSLTWSGRGEYAVIAGTETAADLRPMADATTVALVPELAASFDESEGRALLVYRAGRLQLEHYGAGTGDDTLLNSFSMAKSLIGALTYKALAEGRLSGLDQTLGQLLPKDQGLATITIRELLTMRAGIDFDHGKLGAAVAGKDSSTTANPFGPLARLHFEGLDAIESELEVDPDRVGVFSYQNINTALLGEVLETVYDKPLEVLLGETIWAPAGAQSARWRRNADGQVSAYCCVYATARDWIRVGAYVMHNGTPSRPFLPDVLWREFMGLDIDPAERVVNHYGFHIQQNVLDREGQALQGPLTYFFGQGGQVLYLMPQHGLVVYRAGETEQLFHSTLYGAWNSLPVQ